jgi:hypothetical protein
LVETVPDVLQEEELSEQITEKSILEVNEYFLPAALSESMTMTMTIQPSLPPSLLPSLQFKIQL